MYLNNIWIDIVEMIRRFGCYRSFFFSLSLSLSLSPSLSLSLSLHVTHTIFILLCKRKSFPGIKKILEETQGVNLQNLMYMSVLILSFLPMASMIYLIAPDFRPFVSQIYYMPLPLNYIMIKIYFIRDNWLKPGCEKSSLLITGCYVLLLFFCFVFRFSAFLLLRHTSWGLWGFPVLSWCWFLPSYCWGTQAEACGVSPCCRDADFYSRFCRLLMMCHWIFWNFWGLKSYWVWSWVWSILLLYIDFFCVCGFFWSRFIWLDWLCPCCSGTP